MLELLAEMQRQALEAIVITYSVIISACDKGQQPERALDLLAESGIHPNVITYSATISACAKGQQPEHALELLAESGG